MGERSVFVVQLCLPPSLQFRVTKTSQLLSRDLKIRGWKFFGPTTAYAFMQAIGLVNDHVEGCEIRKIVKTIRSKFVPTN